MRSAPSPLLGPLCAGLLCCGSCADPRAAAAADALDVAGTWDGDDGAVLRIVNESSTADVRATLERTAPHPEERALLARLADADAVVPTLVLGAGEDPLLVELVGGENVSTDGGTTTTLHVRSPALVARPEVDGAEDARARWHLQLRGDADELRGDLVVTTRERRPRAGDPDGAVDEATRVALPVRFVPASRSGS